MTKQTIDIQPNLFWEDENRTPNIIEAANWFKVNALDSDIRHTVRITHKIESRLFRGSCDFARRLGYKYEYANALKWLPVFRNQSVNRDAYFTDAENARLAITWRGERFIRPVAPFKDFAGQVFDYGKFDTELAHLQQNKNLAATEIICVVAAPVEIEREWRCIFVDNEYVGGSRYMSNDALDVAPEVPQEVIDFANTIAKHDYFINNWDFALDVGLVNGVYKLVEINGFETASFYAADLAKIYGAWARQFD